MKSFRKLVFFSILLFLCAVITSACGDSYGGIDYYNPNVAYDGNSIIIIYDNDPKEVTLDDSVIDKLYKLGVLAKDSKHKKELKKADIPDIFTYHGTQYKIVALGESVFEDCESLEKVKIPDSVERIGDYAFYWCKSLEEIELPDSVEEIGRATFKNCSYLKKINIPYKVKKIENETFQNCYCLNNITFGNRITTIGDSAFEQCNSLIEITLPYSLIEIGDSAFEQCTLLQNVMIQDGLRVIGDRAFYNCFHLTLYIPDSVEIIRGFWTLYNVNFYYDGSASGSPWAGNKLE